MAEWVKKQAELEGREIRWADKAGPKGHDHRGRGFAPKGKTPARLDTPSYEKVNMISSVTNQGKPRFMCYEGSFNQQVFHRYLCGAVLAHPNRRILSTSSAFPEESGNTQRRLPLSVARPNP